MFTTENNVSDFYKIYNTFEWLLNSYVLDYFVDNHWEKLPNSWKDLENISIDDISELLDYTSFNKSFVLPLSLLALKSFFKNMCVPRSHSLVHYDASFLESNLGAKLIKIFWKNVKLKKRHEITTMAKFCYEASQKNNCFYLVDVGSGLGHLCRILSYGFKIKCCGIEAQSNLIQQANILDQQFIKLFSKMYRNNPTAYSPVHINHRLEMNVTKEKFLKIIKEAFHIQNDDFEFGIVGLHPCGDLGPTLLRLYKECDNIRFINIVGCCYMKLTTNKYSSYSGFPMSDLFKNLNVNFSYNSREIACHAIENYIEKLKQGQSWKLKIHAYRAAIEKIIINNRPDLKHMPLANIKYTEDLSFESYCKKALSKYDIVLDKEQINSALVQECLTDWHKVVIFYSLRLLFAPMIESVILIDRLKYAQEAGKQASLIPAFDPLISPRNHILSASK